MAFRNTDVGLPGARARIGRAPIFAVGLAAVLVLVALPTLQVVLGQSGHNTVPLSEDQGRRFAEAALAYADVTYVLDGEERQGMPYVWGGRTEVGTFQDATAGGDGFAGGSADLGVDASGLVVAALLDVFPGARFFASTDNGLVLWADTTSAALFHHNAAAVEPSQLRAGDLVFFGSKSEDGAVDVGGVGVVTGRSGARVDFVVASAGQGRVIHTFARIDGEYWQNNIVGAGRLAPGGRLGD